MLESSHPVTSLPASEKSPTAAANDPDTELEEQIQRELYMISAQKSNWFAVSSQRIQVERMDRQYAALVNTCQELRLRLQQVSQDRQDLHSLFQQLEQKLEHYHEILDQSWRIVDFQEVLDSHNAWLDQAIDRLAGEQDPAQEAVSSERLKYMFEDCQELAIQLDELDKDGHKMDFLLNNHELMSAKLNQIKDILEEI